MAGSPTGESLPRGDSAEQVSPAGAKDRAPRPRTMPFAPKEMARDMKELAEHRFPGFAWDGSEYTALGRTLTPCVASLQRHAKPLKFLLKKVPTGFPAQQSMRNWMLALQEEHSVFGDKTPEAAFVAANSGADNWRIMTKHVYMLARDQKIVCFPEVAELVNMIMLPGQPLDASGAGIIKT